MGDVDNRLITAYLLWAKKDHNSGGVHAAFRGLRSFVNWFYKDRQMTGNPLATVLRPKKPKLILKPIELDIVSRLVAYAETRSGLAGLRNRALFYVLLDTGVRANEALMMDICDVDLPGGSLEVRFGKGGKTRRVFFGQKTKKALRSYLYERGDARDNEPLWMTVDGDRLTYPGLRSLFRDYADALGVELPNAHSFRRAFAINSLRNGIDIYSLQHLMGHTSLDVLRQYLDQNEDDLHRAHTLTSPVDKM